MSHNSVFSHTFAKITFLSTDAKQKDKRGTRNHMGLNDLCIKKLPITN